MRLITICVTVLLCSVGAFAQCTLDLDGGILRNETVSVRLPAVGEPGDVALEYDGQVVAPRQWYYCVAGGMQAGSPNFRSTGRVLSVRALEESPDRAAVRITCLTDDPGEPDRGTFTLDYHVRRGSSAVRHEMTFTPKRPEAVRSYQYYVSTEQAAAETHRLHHFEGGSLTATPAQTTAAYGRISFSTDPAFVALEDTRGPLTLAVGVPPADVSGYQYSIEFRRFEVARTAGYIAPNAPVHDFALLAMGPDVEQLAEAWRQFIAEVKRPVREAEPELPTPDLRAERPQPTLTRGLDSRTGALASLDAGGGNLLARPGGIVFVEWPDRTRIAPEDGSVTAPGRAGNPLVWTWEGRGLQVDHEQRAGEPLAWNARVRNDTDQQRLLEVRLELPLAMREGYFFDGMRLVRFDEGSPDHEMTTLVPGERLSQGIFPAACVHDGESGVAIGMPPMHIESFYGARLERSDDGARTLSYVVRWALPPGESRTARFVLYAIDPQWSWRSMAARYWQAWPEVFAAPERDDVWGLYAAASPAHVHNQGDRFIEICRRLRVGAMELYAPFAKTGDFYPDEAPVYRTDDVQTREEMREVQEIANIASCNISYVIPTKCERQMALEKYDDSIIRLADGSRFMLDTWAVMADEKLAGMFAWGNSFGESLREEIRQIVDNYGPDGFYFDNGAFVWQDYGRETSWTAFDDEGRVYTNGGIPYAKIQDDLAEYAPRIHRNPGEFIQYFSGFRGQSHLTNIVGSQRYYVRSHRLIMGYKPIYPGHPSRIGSRQELYDFLELGGLPWLAGIRPSDERLAQAWAPIAVELATAGWRPITNAVADSPKVRVERFGAGPMFFTVRNLSDEPVTTTLAIKGEHPHCYAWYSSREVEARVAAGFTHVEMEIPAREMEFMRAVSDEELAAREEETRYVASDVVDIRALQLLADAPPTSIVVPEDPTGAEERMARRLRAFVLVQADILGHEPVVEIVRGEDSATHEDRVLIEQAEFPLVKTSVGGDGENRVTIEFDEEGEAIADVSALLDFVARPLTGEPAKWVP